MTKLTIQRDEDMFRLVDELKAAPERLDKEMRADFRRLSAPIRDRARAAVLADHPVAKTPRRNRKGSYRWKTLANAVTSSASSIAPTLRYGSDKVPGYGGWEFGSNRFKQFPQKRQFGPFLSTVEEAKPEINESTEKVVLDYVQRHVGSV